MFPSVNPVGYPGFAVPPCQNSRGADKPTGGIARCDGHPGPHPVYHNFPVLISGEQKSAGGADGGLIEFACHFRLTQDIEVDGKLQLQAIPA